LKDTLNASTAKRKEDPCKKLNTFMGLLSRIFSGYFLKFFDEYPIDLGSRQERAALEEKRGNICLKHLLLNPGFF
jgi:hypothetical protein